MKHAQSDTRELANAIRFLAIDAVNKALGRGRPKKEAVQGGISFMQQTIAYEQADDTTREQMVRDINKQFGVKERKAPSVKKVLGIVDTKKLVNVMAALKDQIRLEVRAAKEGAKSYKETVKELLNDIKSLGKSGKLTGSQVKALINTFTRPWLTEIKSILFVPPLLENLFIIGILITSWFYGRKVSATQWKFVIFCLTFSIILFLIIGLTTPIIGAIVRYKIPAIPFLTIAALMFFDGQKLPKSISQNRLLVWINSHL
jgi:hypothetical protein